MRHIDRLYIPSIFPVPLSDLKYCLKMSEQALMNTKKVQKCMTPTIIVGEGERESYTFVPIIVEYFIIHVGLYNTVLHHNTGYRTSALLAGKPALEPKCCS